MHVAPRNSHGGYHLGQNRRLPGSAVLVHAPVGGKHGGQIVLALLHLDLHAFSAVSLEAPGPPPPPPPAASLVRRAFLLHVKDRRLGAGSSLRKCDRG